MELYEGQADEKKMRAARQAISRLREALDQAKFPIDVPAGRTLVLDERWQKKPGGKSSEKGFRIRIQESRPEAMPVQAGHSSPWLRLWFPPSSWTGWIVQGLKTLERDRSISHKHLYTGTRGPDNWLTVAGSEVYQLAERCAGQAIYDEIHQGGDWLQKEVVYLGLGTGSGMADVQVIRELLEHDRNRRVRAVPLDFSPVLLSETVANFYQEFEKEITEGRLELHPILGDLEQPQEWVPLLPQLSQEGSLVIGMFGNTIGHLQYRERATIQAIMDELDGWAQRGGSDPWTIENSRMLLGVSLERKGGAPHGETPKSCRRWLNLVTDPLRTLLETMEGEFETCELAKEDWQDLDGRTLVATLRRRGSSESAPPVGHFLHERLAYKPSDGLAGVIQRYVFQFQEDFSVKGEEVFSRHHVPESRWQSLGEVEANFQGLEDEIVLCEVTQFGLGSFRPALKRLGLLHGDDQVYPVKVGNSVPYAVLAFSRQMD